MAIRNVQVQYVKVAVIIAKSNCGVRYATEPRKTEKPTHWRLDDPCDREAKCKLENDDNICDKRLTLWNQNSDENNNNDDDGD